MNAYDKRTMLDEINRQIAKLAAAAKKVSQEIEADEAAENQKAELIQADQNLAADIVASEAEIADHEKAISAIKARIQALSDKRAMIHREWCEKFANMDGKAAEVPALTAEDVFRTYINVHDEPFTPYDRQQLRKFRRLLQGERMSTSIYDNEPITLAGLVSIFEVSGEKAAAAFVRSQPGWSRITAA